MSEKLRFNSLSKVWDENGEGCEFIVRLRTDRATALGILNSGVDDANDLHAGVNAEVAEALAVETDATRQFGKRRPDLADGERRLQELRTRQVVVGVELHDAIEVGDMSAADKLQGELAALPMQILNYENRISVLAPLVRESERAVDAERQRIEASIRARWAVEMEQGRIDAKAAIGAALTESLLGAYYRAGRQISACNADWVPVSAPCPDTPSMKKAASDAAWQRQQEALEASRAGNDEERRRQERISRDSSYFSQTPGSWLSRLGKIVVG